MANGMTTLHAIESKVPLILRFLSHEDDDISEAVIGFGQDYITLLKQSPSLTQRQREDIEQMLYIIIKKMKYDDTYNFDIEVKKNCFNLSLDSF